MSAPAARAASWFLPLVKTATRTDLPMPCGNTVEPRTCWSDLLASMPRFTATSTDSANLAVANSFTSLSASSIGYCLPGVSLVFQARRRLARADTSEALHFDAHAAGAARNGAHRGLEVGGGQVGGLGLGHFLDLLAGDLAHLVGIGRAAPLFNADGLADQHRGGRRLHDEGEGTIRIHGDHHRYQQGPLLFLGLSSALLSAIPDVHTQPAPPRGAQAPSARRNLP